MRTAQAFVSGTTLGGGLVYFLDRRRGARRRALVRDKAIRMAGDIEHTVAIGVRDLEHRVRGLVAGTLARIVPVDVPEDVLEDRVRAALGHACAHPHAVKVRARGDGMIELQGPVLEEDVERVLHRVRRVPGVRAIVDGLEVCLSADGIPELQGDERARRLASRTRLTPAARAILLTGAWLAALGMAGRRALRFGAGLLAAGAIARSVAQRQSRARERAAHRRSPAGPVRMEGGEEVPPSRL